METLIHKSYIECVSGSNVDSGDANCNTTNMQTSEFAKDLGEEKWNFSSEFNDMYAYLRRDLVRSTESTLVLPVDPYYYTAGKYYTDSDLVFPTESFKYARGAVNGTAKSPVSFACVG